MAGEEEVILGAELDAVGVTTGLVVIVEAIGVDAVVVGCGLDAAGVDVDVADVLQPNNAEAQIPRTTRMAKTLFILTSLRAIDRLWSISPNGISYTHAIHGNLIREA